MFGIEHAYRHRVWRSAREEGFAVCTACGYFGGGRVDSGQVRCAECGTTPAD